MPLLVATSCLARPRDLRGVLEAYRLVALRPVEVAPGHPREPGLAKGLAGFEPPAAVHQHLPLAEDPWELNLAAGDEDVRRASVARAEAMLRWCAAYGVPRCSFHVGHALEEARRLDGSDLADLSPITTYRASDQLLRSLDRLCTLSDDLAVTLAVENPASGLLSHPEDLLALLDRLGAPHLGLLLDLAHLRLACHAARRDADAALAMLVPRVRAVHLSQGWPTRQLDLHGMPREDEWELEALRRHRELGAMDVTLEARGLELAAIMEASAMLGELLVPVAGPAGA